MRGDLESPAPSVVWGRSVRTGRLRPGERPLTEPSSDVAFMIFHFSRVQGTPAL